MELCQANIGGSPVRNAYSAGIEIGFVDRFSGALLITGDVSAVESFLRSVIEGLERILGFYPTELTRT